MNATRTVEISSIGKRLQKASIAVRRNALQMVHHAKLGHLGGDFSSSDILVTLYLAVMKIDPLNPAWPDRDRFVMSKGHCSAALYATLVAAGMLNEAALATFMDPLSQLNGHPDRNKVPGVEANTGPLGHGLPIATGCALAVKMQRATWRTFVITGDGELQEGSNWEAAMTAAQYKLDNLTLIVDRNRIQQGDFTENTINMNPLGDKWRAFGWHVIEVDGHNHGELLHALSSTPEMPGKPTCIIANTIKGHGVSFMENNPAWHHGVPTDAQLSQALDELAMEEI
ncbi:MAG: transketolase [Acidobacteriota bacterium]|nr:transketolase [Acidobacteriota bacterium]